VKHNHNPEIEAYINELKIYNEHTNIYSKKAYDKLPFHIEDGITLSMLLPEDVKQIVDFGSGSGLPAVILSITKPNTHVIAIESKSKKTNFLCKVKETLNLENLTIVNMDINEYLKKSQPCPEVITAKAFAHIDKTSTIINKADVRNTTLWVPISENQKTEYQNMPNVTINETNGFIYCTKRFK